MKVPNDNYFDRPIVNPRYIRKNYPEFFLMLNEEYPQDLTISEKIYWWKNSLNDYPKCHCGERVKFYGIKKGYAKYCSYKCSSSDPKKKQKVRETCVEKYGVDNPNKSSKIRAKAKETCIEKYGVDNPSKSNEIKKKIKEIHLEKYGVEWIGQCEEIKNKIKNTLNDKYGVSSPLYLPQTSINREESRIRRLKDKYKEFDGVEDNLYILKCPHKNCNKCQEKYYKIPPKAFYDRRRDGTEPCTHLLPFRDFSNSSGLESQVKMILDELGVKYECNNRDIIKPKELDIYIPSKGIAIECNGAFIHCTKKLQDNKYHINKTKCCQDKGIQLIHLWEDWIKNKYDIVKSLLMNKLGCCNESIYARNTIVKEITPKVCNKFLDENHIQGKSRSVIKLGLYYEDELVSVMTFGKKRMNSGDNKIVAGEWELFRFCNKLNTRVVGGASKLLKYFIKNYNPTSIVSFSMNDISDGRLYERLGFKKCGTNNSYWYIKNGTLERYHRSNFTKDSIVSLGWKERNDNSWEEEEVMYEKRYFKIIDSGQLKWVWNSSQ